jgi:hypothetical protein
MASDDEIGHFRILRQIGRGGQATVYVADDRRPWLPEPDTHANGFPGAE